MHGHRRGCYPRGVTKRDDLPTPPRVPRQGQPRHGASLANYEEEHTPVVGLTVPAYVPGDGRRPVLVALAGPLLGEVFVIGPAGLLVGRDPAAPVHLFDEGVSRRHARFEVIDGATRVVDLGSTNGTFVAGNRVRAHVLADGDRIRIGQTSVFKFTYQDPLEEACARQLLEAALRDPLTRAFNRRYFRQRLAAEMAYADRHKTPLALLIVDIDHFKMINDTLGHPVGDQVLVRLAEVIFTKIRLDDVLARWGGEEFTVIARDTNLDGALKLGERLRVAVAEALFEHEERPIEVRLSIGVAALPDPELRDLDAFVRRADEALFRAKRGGRNRVSP